MRGRTLSVMCLLSLLGILLMLNFVSPKQAGILGVLVFFTMVFMVIFSVAVSIIKAFQKILGSKSFGRGVNSGGDSSNKVYMCATILSFGPVILLTVRTIDLFIVLLTGVFMVLGCFLVWKRA